MRLILAEEPTVQFSEVAQIFIAAFDRTSYAGLKSTVDKTMDKEPSSTARKILERVVSNPVITQKELAACLGLTEDGVYYHITKLKGLGLLTRSGGKKAGRWAMLKYKEVEPGK